MALKETELTLGRRVMVPRDRVPDCRPWAERYGEIVGIERFLGTAPLISVCLDGEGGHVIGCRLAELDHE